MPNLCSTTECTGCFACANICPANAIDRLEDNHGFYHPTIINKCIECKACEKVCPILNGPTSRSSNKTKPFTLAGWHGNKAIRMDSSSGGAFSALAESVLKKGGIVYGAGWGTGLRVEHKRVDSLKNLEDLRKSKYVQSDIGETYKKTRRDLLNGKIVLYSGSPCQIAGLYTFLHNKQYDNLYTVDYICHGVPSHKVFHAYIKSLENKYNDKINSVNFRDKRLGVETNLIIKIGLESSNNYKCLMGSQISFYRGFIGDLFLRDCCYDCRFNKMPRVADISLADYRGLGDKYQFKYELDRIYGFTGVTINNDHGKTLLEMSELKYEERPFEEFSGSQDMLRTPAKRNPNTESFYRDLEKYGFPYTADKYMKMTMHGRIDYFLRRILGPKGYYILGRLVKKYIYKTRTV